MKHPEHSIWRHMLRRCTDTNCKDYHRYGARGVKVCGRWRLSFQAFLDDMGPRPTPAHSIERIKNHLGYQPDNCRWATLVEQCRNRRSNTLLTLDGETKTQIEWSEATGIPAASIHWRLLNGWSVARALMTPNASRLTPSARG